MYTILKTSGAKKLLTTEAPAFAFALLLAEQLYKFGSFTLECLAFLVTWLVVSFLVHNIVFYQRQKKGIHNR